MRAAQPNPAQIEAIDLHNPPVWEPDALRYVWDTSYAATYAPPNKQIGAPYHWTREEYSNLRYSLDQSLPQEKTRKAALERIDILACDGQDRTLESCYAAKLPPPPSHVTDWRKKLETASADGTAYQRALQAVWREIACSGDKAIYILSGATPILYRVTWMNEAELIDFIQGEHCDAFASLTTEQQTLLLKYGGVAYKNKGEYDHAIADYNKAIELAPQDADAYKYRGRAYEEKPDYDHAIADYNKAIELAPQDADAYKYRGRAYDKNGDFERAIVDFNKAIELYPSDANTHSLLGNALRAQGSTDDAIAEIRKAVELAPNDAFDHQLLGQGLLSQSKTGEAIAEFRKAVELAPNDAFARDDIGRALLNQGKTDEAVVEFRKAAELDPKDPYAVLWLYLARARSGAHHAAAELKTNAIKLKQPDWPYPIVELFLDRRTPEASLDAPTTPDGRCEAQFFVGEWRLLRGDYPKALESLKSAVGTCPKRNIEYDFARAELKRLEP